MLGRILVASGMSWQVLSSSNTSLLEVQEQQGIPSNCQNALVAASTSERKFGIEGYEIPTSHKMCSMELIFDSNT